MVRIIAFLVLFICSNSFCQTYDTINFNIDLGGVPLDTNYLDNFEQKNYLIIYPENEPSKKILKSFESLGYAYLDIKLLINHNFPFNSIFHYQPIKIISEQNLNYYNNIGSMHSSDLDFIVYGNRSYQDRDSYMDESSLHYDSLYQQYFKDTTLFDSTINQISQPFFLAKVPTTNKQYNEFVSYVIDSIAKELIFKNLPLYIESEERYDLRENLYELIDFKKYYPKSKYKLFWDTLDLNDYKNNREIGFKAEKLDFYDGELMPFYTSMYLPDYERFYKRREFDPRKIIYRDINDKGDTVMTNVSRDTTNFQLLKDPKFNIYENLFAWHPAFDNYSVNNISYQQAKAYCHFLENKLNKLFPSSTYNINVDLPSYYHYEWALIDHLHKNKVYLDPLFGNNLSDTLDFYSPYAFDNKNRLPIESYFRGENNDIRKYKSLKERIKTGRRNFYPKDVDLNHTNGEVYLGNNTVSELTNDVFTLEYLSNLGVYWDYRRSTKTGYSNEQLAIERTPAIGKRLILGSNWAYPIHQDYFGINAKATLTETYVGDDETNTKMGFRTVITFVPK